MTSSLKLPRTPTGWALELEARAFFDGVFDFLWIGRHGAPGRGDKCTRHRGPGAERDAQGIHRRVAAAQHDDAKAFHLRVGREGMRRRCGAE